MTIEPLYTVTVFSENHVGLLNQLSIIFTRRGINIESISASCTAKPGIHKITLTCHSDNLMMDKVIKQIEKRIDVIKAFYYTDEDIVYQEIALYKVSTPLLLEGRNLENIIRRHSARVLQITPEYTVIEKTGHLDETQALFEELQKYELRQFVRSGRVAITKSSIEHIDNLLRHRETQNPAKQ